MNTTDPIQTDPFIVAGVYDDLHVWRYLNLAKYVSMLSTSSLYFSPLESMTDDPREGTLSTPTRQAMKQALQQQLEDAGLDGSIADKSAESQTDDYEKTIRKWVFVNCWSAHEGESAALWKIYAGDFGLAVRTTAGHLKNATASSSAQLGFVTYTNYKNKVFRFGNANIFTPALHKRREFNYETEVRALILGPRASTQSLAVPDLASSQPEAEHGLLVPVDLRQLVQGITISPTSPRWFLDTVRDLTKRYGFDWSVNYSSLIDGE
jgi:hypothetical protein